VHSIAKTADVNLTANNLKNSFCHRVTETQRNSQERSENFSLIKTVIPHYWREEKKDREFMADWASSEQKSLCLCDSVAKQAFKSLSEPDCMVLSY
jgi:hypothetical protein